MTETPKQELFRQISETRTPDKKRYARVHRLTREISGNIGEPQRARSLSREFRNAYMDLQLAILRSNDTALLDLYRKQCARTATRMCDAAGTDTARASA